MVASLPPLACALCDHPISPDALRRRLRCPRCGHRHGLRARHRLPLAHIQRRRLQAAVDRSAADEAASPAGAGARLLAAVIVAVALPPLLRPYTDAIALHDGAWMVVAVGLAVAVAMAATLQLLLEPTEPSATTPVRVDAHHLDRALLDAEAAAWRAGIARHGIGHRAAARVRLPEIAAVGAGGAVAVGTLIVLLGFGGDVELATVAPAAAAAALALVAILRGLAGAQGPELTAARRIAAALGPDDAPRVCGDRSAIARWMETRWAGAVDLEAAPGGAGVAIERGDLEALAAVLPARYVPLRPGVGRLAEPERVRIFVPFVTPPLALRDADSRHAAAIVGDLQASGWHLAHAPGVGLQATRLAPSEALHFTHDQLAAVAQTMPALLDLAAALGGVPPRALRERELLTLQPARAAG